jgi:hypothetical protein
METINFIIPTYLEVRDSLSHLDSQFIAFALVAFCLGYLLMRRVRDKKLMNGMREEAEELRARVQGAEGLLAKINAYELREEIHVVEAEVAKRNASQPIISYPEMEDTDIADGPDTLEEVEPGDLWEMYHKPEHRKVVLTKLVGSEYAGTPLQSPELGFEILPAVVGKPYLVELERGGLLRTSVVTKISDGYIHTHNSLYKVEVLNEEREFSQED